MYHVHHASICVNVVISVLVVLCELHVIVRVHVIPLCDDAVIGLTLGLIAHVVIVVFVVAILHRIFCIWRYNLYKMRRMSRPKARSANGSPALDPRRVAATSFTHCVAAHVLDSASDRSRRRCGDCSIVSLAGLASPRETLQRPHQQKTQMQSVASVVG